MRTSVTKHIKYLAKKHYPNIKGLPYCLLMKHVHRIYLSEILFVFFTQEGLGFTFLFFIFTGQRLGFTFLFAIGLGFYCSDIEYNLIKYKAT